MMRGVVATVLLLMTGCERPTAPGDPGRVELISELGFVISAEQTYRMNGGMPTSEHAVLADRRWGVLMRELSAAGYEAANPEHIYEPVAIILHESYGPDSLIYDRTGTLVGGSYTNGALHVPGDYIDPDGWLGTRPTSQPLIHEMTHHWCYRTLGHYCLSTDEETGEEVHRWQMMNGNDIWGIQWMDS